MNVIRLGASRQKGVYAMRFHWIEDVNIHLDGPFSGFVLSGIVIDGVCVDAEYMLIWDGTFPL